MLWLCFACTRVRGFLGSCFKSREHINIESLLDNYNFDLLPDCQAVGPFVVGSKVIREKSRGGRFLWNKN